ncbi:hypothetical protein DH2020_043375 [Rehmannia glutinosa]|uniref:WW domain-containing protein n=1 Tax=Rehmannia glutinosa TaxID=99300 RepID=A0ABR0UKM6_REHGL
MEFTELSLARGFYGDGESEKSLPMKRKWNSEAPITPSVDLQLKHPLPSDWEQCLDLQSGRMYYVNRKTSRKSWNRPHDHHEDHQQKHLDLELNMSTGCSGSSSSNSSEAIKESTSSNMVALACSNCHLLVILCRSSPSCPNCKYVHSLPSSPNSKPTSNWTL